MSTTTAKPLSFQLFGTSFDNANISVQEAFSEANLNYTVASQPLVRVPQDILKQMKEGLPYDWVPTEADIIKSHKATYREDYNRTLGVVGRDYGIVQNAKAFEFLDFIEECSGEKPQIVTAGALGFGERMFICAQLGEDSFLNPNDAIKNYVVFTNSHDGTGAVMCFFTPVRVICQNTLNMAIHSCPNKVVFKHTKNVDRRLDWEIAANRKKAFEVFSKSVKFSEKFIENLEMLKNVTVDTQYVNNFAAQMFLNPAQFKLLQQANGDFAKVDEISTRTKNQINALKDAIDNGVGQEFNRGTKVWLLNGVTTFLHNTKEYKTAQDEFKSMIEGDALKKTQKAYDLLVAA